MDNIRPLQDTTLALGQYCVPSCQARTLALSANPSFSSSIGRERLIGLRINLEILRRTPHLIRPLRATLLYLRINALQVATMS